MKSNPRSISNLGRLDPRKVKALHEELLRQNLQDKELIGAVKEALYGMRAKLYLTEQALGDLDEIIDLMKGH